MSAKSKSSRPSLGRLVISLLVILSILFLLFIWNVLSSAGIVKEPPSEAAKQVVQYGSMLLIPFGMIALGVLLFAFNPVIGGSLIGLGIAIAIGQVLIKEDVIKPSNPS